MSEQNECLTYSFDVDGENFTSAGEASVQVKRILRRIGFDPETIKRVSIAMYEGEINMVIHAGGGVAELFVYEDKIVMKLTDHGPGIADVSLAMQEGFSTAPDNIRSLGFGAGMGLPNMKRYTDDMVIDTKLGEGTTITMTVNV
ncbi:MAG: ATP-binding protein [Clostridia bacterium]|jgi:anti-sigma regulatory factor (Ser/Thr protein kinase)|nr:ATP-binding protein [Clostridia bacterium]MBO7400245.1 ATP-binding protein [Clostridia bacterium]MBP5237941.1 ATP-binding protein [Clostridia bacterium]MBP5657478.1 ATP-binding protein [Clostridia bacterium]MBP5755164.1 ATP-binding protein [Clostridia bacterium]